VHRQADRLMRDPQLEHVSYYSSLACDVNMRSVIYPRPSSYITRRSNPEAEMPIFQLSIRFGVYARLGTLHSHKTVARFARGLAALHR
jgi:hypothetical protein